MYKITKVSSDYLLSFTGFIKKKEMLQWLKELHAELGKDMTRSFGVIVDLRALAPLTPEAEIILSNGLELLRNGGMLRSVVVLHSDLAVRHFRLMAGRPGANGRERYVSATTPGWSDLAFSWIRDGIDP